MGISPRLLSERATITRLSSVVGQAGTCPVTLTLTFTCTQPVLVQFAVTGIVTPPLSVTITGELHGTTQTETVAITASGQLRSQKFWTKISQITTAGTAGTLKAEAVFSTGEKYYQSIVLYSNVPCRTETVSTTRREFLTETVAGFQLASLVVLMTNASGLRIADRVTIGDTMYEIENPGENYDPLGFHHTEAIMKRLQQVP